MYFRSYRLPKMGLDKYLINPVSEHPLTVNMLKDPKHLREICMSRFLSQFFITLGETDMENVSPGDI